MEDEIHEYSAAMQDNLLASQNEIVAKDAKKKAYYRLMRAKDALRAREREMLEQIELI